MDIDSNMKSVLVAICISSVLNIGGNYVGQQQTSLRQDMQIESVQKSVVDNRRNISKITATLVSINNTLIRLKTIMEVSQIREGKYGDTQRSRIQTGQFIRQEDGSYLRLGDPKQDYAGRTSESSNRGRHK